nr:hypothetical protein [Desulfobacterales bacterium]
FIRLNFANGDMVGHTGILPAVRIAVETVDLCLARLVDAVRKAGGVLVATADHGNSDDMYERNKRSGEVVFDPDNGAVKTKTSHSLNPVPVHVYEPSGQLPLRLASRDDLGISSLAATCMTLMGFEPPEDYTPSIVNIGK